MKRRIAALLAMLLVGLGVTFAVATPAQASYTDCAYGLACLWDGQNATGARWTISVSGSGINQCNSFAWNHPEWDNRNVSGVTSFGSGLRLYVYTGFQCTGSTLGFGPGTVTFEWSQGSMWWHNISSWKIV